MIVSFKSYLQHGLKVLKTQGVGALARLIRRQLDRRAGRYYQGFYDYGYEGWLKRKQSPAASAPRSDGPLISIVVPVYNVGVEWLQAAVQSVIDQRYTNWQLCLVDDASTSADIAQTLQRFAASDSRIVVKTNKENMGIAVSSNTAIGMARGQYIALLDHDDLLTTDALLEVVNAIDQNPAAEFFYSDEDKVDQSGRFNTPFFKPDYSPELLLSQNYIGHLVVIRSELIRRLQGFRMGYDGAQDYDLVLRATAAAAQVIHIPRVLYHWRQIPGSTASVYGEKSYAWAAGKRALDDFIVTRVPGTTVETAEIPGTYRVRYPVEGHPAVSVIIPFRDQPQLLDQCLSSVFSHTAWQNIEVIGIDNQSIDPAIQEVKKRWVARDDRVRFVDYDQPFNFSAICNQGVVLARGEYIVLLNNDVEIVSDQWIESMLGLAQQQSIGAVGALLHYPDQRVQHAGIVVGIAGNAGHPFKTFSSSLPGYFGRLKITSNVSAVTAALLMVSRSKYLEVGGLDETLFAVALNDVDLCLKLQQTGYRNVINADCQAIHFESVSRGSDRDPMKKVRYLNEVQAFENKWAAFIENGDPFYNPNLTLISEDYTLR